MKIKSVIKQFVIFVKYYYFICRNRKIGYFDFKKLAINFPVFSLSTESGIIGNRCYGNLRSVKKALGKDFEKKCLIEHGLYFGEYVIESECQIKGIKTIYTFGEYRINALKKSNIKELKNINLVSVGPYIAYSKNFYNTKKRQKIKNKFGKILLVFPYHTSPELDTYYDKDIFISEIKKVKSDYDFDSVFVSLFWIDIINGNYKFFEKEGFTIVCSGVRNDPYFLQREKDLIELSDLTMSNEIGTHIGYCITLHKPHYLFNQEIQTIKYNFKSEEANESRIDKIKLEKNMFYSLFGNPTMKISKEQQNIVDFYWGKILNF